MKRPPRVGAVVLAAGESKRFGSRTPKVLHPACGRPLVGHVLETLRAVHRGIRLDAVCLVTPPGGAVEEAVGRLAFPFPVAFGVQRTPRGTGDAVRVALGRLDAGVDEVVVLAGDAPLVRPASLRRLVRERRRRNAAAGVLTAHLDDPAAYGRVVLDGRRVTRIVEARDASPAELAIRETNTCTYAFAIDALAWALPRLRTANAQREYYLTDAVAELSKRGDLVCAVRGESIEGLGANTRAEFAAVVRHLRERIVGDLMAAGVAIADPSATYVDAGVRVGRDTVLLPGTFLEGTTRIAAGCEIGPNVRLVDTTVGAGARITFAVARSARIGPHAEVGPFASLRPGTVLAARAKAGTFVEMKNASVGEGSKVPHLSYMGDVTIGAGANVGAGSITCNYDGEAKHHTWIGDRAFVGSDTILVAPVRVGAGAYTGAGSVVNRDVAAGELVYGVPAKPRRPGRRRSRTGEEG